MLGYEGEELLSFLDLECRGQPKADVLSVRTPLELIKLRVLFSQCETLLARDRKWILLHRYGQVFRSHVSVVIAHHLVCFLEHSFKKQLHLVGQNAYYFLALLAHVFHESLNARITLNQTGLELQNHFDLLGGRETACV